MEKPKYLSAINISLYIIIIILTIIKLVINFTEAMYSASVISDIIINFIILICAIILIIFYKIYLIRIIISYIILINWIGALLTSIFSYGDLFNDSKMRGIYNLVSYTKLGLCFACFMIGILDDDF